MYMYICGASCQLPSPPVKREFCSVKFTPKYTCLSKMTVFFSVSVIFTPKFKIHAA